LREALERSAGASVNALSGTGDKLRNELTQVLDRLGATSATLERIVGSAGSDLNAVESGLAERVGEFQRALGSISARFPASTAHRRRRRPKRARSSTGSPNTPIRSPASPMISPRRRRLSIRRWSAGAKACNC